MEKVITRKRKKQISIARITILGMFLALLITLKYAFGFVPGIEMVSFLFIIFGMFLPIFDLTLLVVCFNLLIIVIYGFGNWWFAYWVIWPIDAFLSKALTKFSKNRFVFSLFGFLVGASVGFWYFFSDLIFFGKTFAILNIITAIPINVIEGFTTMLLIIVVAPLLTKVMARYSSKFWGNSNPFKFKEVKWPKIGIFMNVFLALGSIAGTVTLFVYNHSFISWKERETKKIMHHGEIGKGTSSFIDKKRVLDPQAYNTFLNSLKDDEVGIVVIANGKYYSEHVPFKPGATVFDEMKLGKDIHFKTHDSGSYLGEWIQTFKLDGDSQWRHGTAVTKNYGDYYPLYFINHGFAQFGVSNWHVSAKEIYEITYDHDA